MKQCEGFGRPAGESAGTLVQCPYDAMPEADHCYFHAKVVVGAIKDAGGEHLSWYPGRKPKNPAYEAVENHDPERQLQEEWS